MKKQNSLSVNLKKSSLFLGTLLVVSGCVMPGSGEFTAPDLSNTVSHNTANYGVCYEAALSDAWDFNVFVLGDFTAPSADTEGRLAVGGNAYISNYSVGESLDVDATRTDLIVAGNLEFPSGAINKGKTVYGTIETVLSVTGSDVVTYESKIGNSSWHITKLSIIK